MTLRRLLGINFPLIQAPMAGVQGSALTVAVSNAGGLGSLPGAMLSPDGLQNELRAISAQTDRPYNVNFFCHAQPVPDPEREYAWRRVLAPYYEEFGLDVTAVLAGPGRFPFDQTTVEVLAAFRPPVVSFHFGLPGPELVSRVRSWGGKILSTATTVNEALWLEERGVDAIIAQGYEAGGHRGMFLSEDLTTQVGTFALVRRVVRAVRTPVIAAGGIADRESVAAALALGAAGVQVGTAYLLCSEATTTPIHRASLKSAAAQHTAVTNLFTGRPARGIINRLMRECGPLRSDLPPFPLASAAVAPLRASAELKGRGDFSPLWAGQNVEGCEEISAAALTVKLTDGFLNA